MRFERIEDSKAAVIECCKPDLIWLIKSEELADESRLLMWDHSSDALVERRLNALAASKNFGSELAKAHLILFKQAWMDNKSGWLAQLAARCGGE